jgi:hypothetical protein
MCRRWSFAKHIIEIKCQATFNKQGAKRNHYGVKAL